MRQTLLNFILVNIFFSCTIFKGNVPNNDSIIVRPDFKAYFDECKVEGSIAIYDYNKAIWILSDTVGTKMETLPASTFKIINLLIALETKTIKDENDIIKWVGASDTAKYGYRPAIYKDMTVQEAFKSSAVWVFIELAKKIGRENYKKYLSLCEYGNLNLSNMDSDFWNFGSFGISPINQVQFIKKLYEEKLPFSKRNMRIVKKVMLTEIKTGNEIHAKTGWTREGGINIGWWVGYSVNKKGVYFFATRLLQDRKINNSNFGNSRKDITVSILKNLKVIE